MHNAKAKTYIYVVGTRGGVLESVCTAKITKCRRRELGVVSGN